MQKASWMAAFLIVGFVASHSLAFGQDLPFPLFLVSDETADTQEILPASEYYLIREGIDHADNTTTPTDSTPSLFEVCSGEDRCCDLWGNACTSQECSNSCGCCDIAASAPSSGWYFQAEALFLHRDNQLRNRPVVVTSDTGNTVLSTGDLNGDWGVGQRYLLGRQLDACSAVEASYFGIIDWNTGNRLASQTNNLGIPPDLNVPGTDYANADTMRIRSSSRLNNVEFNYVRTVSGSPWHGTSILAGFRYVNFNNSFNIASDDGDDILSHYNIKAKNNLYGAQIGLRTVRTYSRWGWDVTGKAGLFGNDAKQRQFIEDQPGGLIRPLPGDGSSVGSRHDSVAFVGDINTSLVLRLTDTWSLRGGYNVMWIEGLALAGDQLDFSFTSASGTRQSNSGGVFLHGASVGLQARW